MTSTVIVRMASGAEHVIELPTDRADALVKEFTGVWTGRRAGPAHTLHRRDGVSVTINPHHVETIERS